MEDIFGRPREGSHRYRIPLIDLAVVDVLLTFVGAVLIGYGMGYNIFVVFIILMLISIPIHLMFGVRTALIDKIF